MLDILVFVYGTLKQGGSNHQLMRRARLLGAHRTEPAFTMHHLGGYPGLRPGGRSAISGEVYAIDERTLRALDRLEDYPRLYDRVLIPTPYGEAWVYLLRQASAAPVIPEGEWGECMARGRNEL